MKLDKQKFDLPALEANFPKVYMTVKTLKRYKSPGTDPITTRNIISEIDKLIICVRNKEQTSDYKVEYCFLHL